MSDVQDRNFKTCSKCATAKPIDEFGVESRRPDGRRCHCRQCGRCDRKPYRTANHDRVKKWNRKYKLKAKYGISPAEFSIMLADQGGRCAICQTERPGGKHNCFMVDHDHKTGVVRGLLCHACNLALGILGDDEGGVLRALDYIRSTGKYSFRARQDNVDAHLSI